MKEGLKSEFEGDDDEGRFHGTSKYSTLSECKLIMLNSTKNIFGFINRKKALINSNSLRYQVQAKKQGRDVRKEGKITSTG